MCIFGYNINILCFAFSRLSPRSNAGVGSEIPADFIKIIKLIFIRNIYNTCLESNKITKTSMVYIHWSNIKTNKQKLTHREPLLRNKPAKLYASCGHRMNDQRFWKKKKINKVFEVLASQKRTLWYGEPFSLTNKNLNT